MRVRLAQVRALRVNLFIDREDKTFLFICRLCFYPCDCAFYEVSRKNKEEVIRATLIQFHATTYIWYVYPFLCLVFRAHIIYSRWIAPWSVRVWRASRLWCWGWPRVGPDRLWSLSRCSTPSPRSCSAPGTSCSPSARRGSNPWTRRSRSGMPDTSRTDCAPAWNYKYIMYIPTHACVFTYSFVEQTVRRCTGES